MCHYCLRSMAAPTATTCSWVVVGRRVRGGSVAEPTDIVVRSIFAEG